MSDLIHMSILCKAHLNMLVENALYEFITIIILLAMLKSSRSYLSAHKQLPIFSLLQESKLFFFQVAVCLSVSNVAAIALADIRPVVI